MKIGKKMHKADVVEWLGPADPAEPANAMLRHALQSFLDANGTWDAFGRFVEPHIGDMFRRLFDMPRLNTSRAFTNF